MTSSDHPDAKRQLEGEGTEAGAPTRADHLQWCKDRALEYVDHGDLASAVTSMASDMEKHPDTAGINPTLIQLGMMEILNHNAAGVRRWVEGFN